MLKPKPEVKKPEEAKEAEEMGANNTALPRVGKRRILYYSRYTYFDD